MKRFFLFLALLCATSAPLRAQEKPASFEFRDTPIREVVATLARAAGTAITVSDDVPDIRINLNIRDIAPSQCLRIMLRQAGAVVPLVAVSRGNTLVIEPAPLEQEERHPVSFSRPDPRLAAKVTLSLEHTRSGRRWASCSTPPRCGWLWTRQCPPSPFRWW